MVACHDVKFTQIQSYQDQVDHVFSDRWLPCTIHFPTSFTEIYHGRPPILSFLVQYSGAGHHGLVRQDPSLA